MQRLKAWVPALIAPVLRILGATWRIRLIDHAGLTGSEPVPSVIWVLWHNRLLIVPILYQRFFCHRPGVALISRSKDGAILSGIIERFGGFAIRGSSSRGGATALGELRNRVAKGFDVYITPDGPRGPKYSMSPGALWLSQNSRAPILPLSVEYSSCWRLGRWDGFVIPKPFSTVTVTLQQLIPAPDVESSGDGSANQERLREQMMAGTELH